MESTKRVCEVVDQLHEELDAATDTLTPFALGAVVRQCAELVIEREDEEFACLSAYLRYHCPGDLRLQLALEQAAIGAHRRRASQSMEAVVEQSTTTMVRRRRTG